MPSGRSGRRNTSFYAHAAVARKVGQPERAIANLVAGELCEDLRDAEQIAQQYATHLRALRRIDADLFAAAKQAFVPKGSVDITSPETPAHAARPARSSGH